MTTLSDLARVKAIFQQRAICAAMGILVDASQPQGEVKAVVSHTSTTNKESE